MTDPDRPSRASPDAPGPDPAESGTAERTTPGPATGPAVLDASALLAWLRAEPGADVVEPHLESAVISAVNLSEIYQKLAQRGVDADRTLRQLRTLGIRTEPLDAADAIAAANLWPATRPAGLSLGDRCCLALAARLGGPAITADTAWTTLDVGVAIVPIRENPPDTGPPPRSERHVMTETPPSPARAASPTSGNDSPLSTLEAASALGITEDEVLIRQRRGDLPAQLSVADLDADVVLAELRRP